jgi:hypothetical protein
MASPEATAPVVFDSSIGTVTIPHREKDGKSKKLVNLICFY